VARLFANKAMGLPRPIVLWSSLKVKLSFRFKRSFFLRKCFTSCYDNHIQILTISLEISFDMTSKTRCFSEDSHTEESNPRCFFKDFVVFFLIHSFWRAVTICSCNPARDKIFYINF
jgi:hypothetical protein